MESYSKRREELSKQSSKSRLKAEVKKRITTTMIGALVTFEKYFSHLWERGSKSDEFKQAFEEARQEILDRGNDQIRKMENDFATFDIVSNKFHINLPVLGAINE